MSAMVMFSSASIKAEQLPVCLLQGHKVETMVMETVENDTCELKEMKNFKDEINQNQGKPANSKATPVSNWNANETEEHTEAPQRFKLNQLVTC